MGYLKNIWKKFSSLKTWHKIVVVFVGLGALGAAGGSESSATPPSLPLTPSDSATPKATKAAKPSGSAIGSSASGAKFIFAVWKSIARKRLSR